MLGMKQWVRNIIIEITAPGIWRYVRSSDVISDL